MILKMLMREYLEVFTVTEIARVSEVAELMLEKKVGSIVVVDDANHVIGIITDRDIAMALALGEASAHSLVSEVMTEEVETIPDSMTLFDVARFFKTVAFKRLPIVDGDKRLAGIVSTDDLVALLAREMFDTCGSLEPKIGHMV